MLNNIIQITFPDKDLDPQPEFWQSDTFDHRQDEILEYVRANTGDIPSKNMRPIRVISFAVVSSTTIEMLIALAGKLKQWYMIDCFQCSIDRTDNTAYMMFDWNNRTTAKSVAINSSQQIAMAVMILRTLNLPRPKNSDSLLRFFLVGEFSEDPKVFADILNQLKHAGLSKRKYHIVRDVLKYVQMVCQGLVK